MNETPPSETPLPATAQDETLDDVVGVLFEGRPAVESYIDAPPPGGGNPPGAGGSEAQKPADKPEGPTDSKGNRFDSAIHRADKDGNPVKNKDGTFAKKPGMGARKAAGRVNIPGNAGAPSDAPGAPSPVHSDPALASAITTVSVYFGLGQMIDAEEWKPINDEYKLPTGETIKYNEQEQLTAAFYQYYKMKGIEDIPPELMIVIPIAASITYRMQKPKTGTVIKHCLKNAFNSVKKAFSKMKDAMPKRKAD